MITVLLIEDNPGDAVLVNEYLKESTSFEYKLIHTTRNAEAAKILGEVPSIDVIISDIALPDSKGVESIKQLQEFTDTLPVIFFTGTHDEELAMSALQEGAQDYLIKGQFDGEALRRAIRYAIERKKYQNEAEHATMKARKLQHETELLQEERTHLKQLNQAKDDFLSLASHQLRTPATGVKQYLGMVLEGFFGDIPDKQRHSLQQAFDSNERQLKIVEDLLRTAHIDAGRTKIEKVDTDIVELLGSIIDEQKNHFAKRKQIVEFNTKTKPYKISVDADKLRMALENIIDNASKYTPDGKKITVTLTHNKKTVTIDIADQGVGIGEEDISKIFDKFARVNNPLSHEVGGSGLGLFWAKSIIDLHNGSIAVKSEVNKGTTFSITLPA